MLTIDTSKDAEEKSMVEKLGLNDWKFAVPVGLLVGIPAVSNEVNILLPDLYEC